MTDVKTWEQRVAAWRSSGQSARELAEGRDYTVHMLRYWARRVGGGTAPASERPVRLARVIRSRADVGAAAAVSGALAIEMGGARVIVFGSGRYLVLVRIRPRWPMGIRFHGDRCSTNSTAISDSAAGVLE